MVALSMQINNMVEQLHEPEQVLILEIVKRFLPDDVATPEDLDIIAAAREEYRCGETISDGNIDWD
jgi:hypothetical protein